MGARQAILRVLSRRKGRKKTRPIFPDVADKAEGDQRLFAFVVRGLARLSIRPRTTLR
jgi:hypothetical protein